MAKNHLIVVRLSKQEREFVLQRVQSEGFSTVAAFIRQRIHQPSTEEQMMRVIQKIQIRQ